MAVFRKLLACLLAVALMAGLAAAAADTTPTVKRTSDGFVRVSWPSFGSGSSYNVRYLISGGSVTWHDAGMQRLLENHATLQRLVPGETYRVYVDCGSSTIQTTFTAPYDGQFTEFTHGIEVNLLLRYNENGKREIARNGYPVNDVLYNSNRQYFIYYRYDYPTLGRSRTYNAKVAIRSPLGYMAYTYNDVLQLKAGNTYWSGEMDVRPILEAVQKDYGYVPTGTYYYELYVDNQFAGQASFNVT